MNPAAGDRNLVAQLALAQRQAHTADAQRAEADADLLETRAALRRADAVATRSHAEAALAVAAVAEVRRFCQMTTTSIRVQAAQQARDTLEILDAITGADPLPGDAAWHSVWLHGNWSWLTENMTTPEREHAADAVARYGAHLNAEDPNLGPAEPEGLRWWRDDRGGRVT